MRSSSTTRTCTLKDPKTIRAYEAAVEEFRKSCTKKFLSEIGRQDLIDFMGWLRKQPPKLRRDGTPRKPRRSGDPNRTYFNKVNNVVIFLSAHGIRSGHTGLLTAAWRSHASGIIAGFDWRAFWPAARGWRRFATRSDRKDRNGIWRDSFWSIWQQQRICPERCWSGCISAAFQSNLVEGGRKQLGPTQQGNRIQSESGGGYGYGRQSAPSSPAPAAQPAPSPTAAPAPTPAPIQHDHQGAFGHDGGGHQGNY